MQLKRLTLGIACGLFLWVTVGCASTGEAENVPLGPTPYAQNPAFYSYIVGSVNSQAPATKEYASGVYITPASCQKTITALLAYKTLGDSFQYQTTVSVSYQEEKVKKHASHAPQKALQDLVISFSGDPTFTSDQFLQLLSSFQGNKFSGRIFIDVSKFKTPAISPNVMLDDVGQSYLPPVSAFILDRNQTPDGSAKDLDAYAQEKVAALLAQLNIKGTVEFVTDSAHLPTNTTLISTNRSISLGNMLPPALKESDNLVFDSLYLTIVATKNPNIVKWEEGYAIVKSLVLEYFAVDMGNSLMIDGSGASRYNRIQTKTLFDILRQGYAMPEFIAALPRPGEASSTLDKRTLLVPTIRAKTGSMSGISCLCGYNQIPQGDQAFVFVAQNFAPPLQQMYAVQDEFLNGLLSSSR